MKFTFSILSVSSLMAIALLPAIGSAAPSPVKKSQINAHEGSRLAARGYDSNSHAAEIDRSLDYSYPQRVARRAVYKRTPVRTQADDQADIAYHTNQKNMHVGQAAQQRSQAADKRRQAANAAKMSHAMSSHQKMADIANRQAAEHDARAAEHDGHAARHGEEINRHAINLAEKKKQGIP